MDVRRFLAACVFTGAAIVRGRTVHRRAAWTISSASGTPPAVISPASTSSRRPSSTKKQDYASALRLFELSGYWADKVAQYNAGIMYFNGIGVPTDKVLGTAWLGIAAEAHDSLADQALQAAYAELTPEQRSQADVAFQQLDEKYGDESCCRGHCGVTRRTRR